ncbi:nicotinate phosphoribosyltransferase [Spiroplasma turonicum]|uniref:nicotinate phosphoribosyltransferase n=1 Tax=Spiroplasma turonicum TaxID=216946 RepID=A0A0K1P5D6_9MOLU|nr:nicotinate phosphoribosyltransferase [Spiroplasma turonicum]AKU79394.1 nicotinate phosphoribosyltransferase [Spiroplasma turonicum]ALX70415.1 nicotinate phosphoribosyltransferase [Spiroplasma turonicum]
MKNSINKINFHFDERIKSDFYTADYFVKTRNIINNQLKDSTFTMQWFQRQKDVFFCGSEIIKKLLEFKGSKDIIFEYLEEGSIIQPFEPVLRITGKYKDFCDLEGLIDGILSRSTTVANNAHKIKLAANNKQVINMNDRMDIYLNQQIDGYSSFVAGLSNLVTPASFEYLGIKPNLKGTMPHSLIAAFNGDITLAAKSYLNQYPDNNLVVLVDYNNDVINDSIKVCNELKDKVYAVRIDTSANLIDKSLELLDINNEELYGVNVTLVKLLRDALDFNGFNNVKIVASSGFDENKIAEFESKNSMVDIYGVGEALTKNKINFTGDVVKVNGLEQAKFGRKFIESFRLKSIKY